MTAIHEPLLSPVRTARCVPAVPDAGWDRFVATAPGGTMEQTTAWAETKRRLGMHPMLVTMTSADRLVGGGVIQVTSIAPGVRVGYAPHGPLLGASDGDHADAIVGALVDAGRRLHLRGLVVQPARDTVVPEPVLAGRGFVPSPLAVATDATAVIDLTRTVEAMTAALSSSRRHVKRLAESALRIREATDDADLDVFHRLYVASAQRQGFVPVTAAYVRAQWSVLRPLGLLRLFVAELDGCAVAAETATFFGDTVTPRLKGWAGDDRKLRAPELLEWWLVLLAKAEGYRRYDQGGINRDYALGVLAGEGVAVSELKAAHPSAYYKHSFGGSVELLPPPFLHVYNPLARTVVRRLGPRLAHDDRLRRLANRWKSG